MNGREAVEKRLRRSVKLLERYKYVLLVLLAGLLLPLLPGTGEGSALPVRLPAFFPPPTSWIPSCMPVPSC